MRRGENAYAFSTLLGMEIQTLRLDPRITVRKPGAPNREGESVVYWMQRAQRALDNPALDGAVKLGNELGKPVVSFFAPVPFYPHANLRHYRFLTSGIPDIEEGLSKRNVGFVLRTYPDHSLIKFCEQVRAIVGKHDRPWFERPVFGQVRYMSYSTSKKFDSKHYIQNVRRREASHV